MKFNTPLYQVELHGIGFLEIAQHQQKFCTSSKI